MAKFEMAGAGAKARSTGSEELASVRHEQSRHTLIAASAHRNGKKASVIIRRAP
jgi:hypothetical protein